MRLSKPAVKMVRLHSCFLLLAIFAGFAVQAAPSWPQFRGPNGQGIAEHDRPPTEFGLGTNLLWKTEVPGGVSSPCVWGDRIFLTAFSIGKLETLCLDCRDGRILWRQVAPAAAIKWVNELGSPAAATPATDGRRVYVYFSVFGLLAYDFNGRERWRKLVPIANPATGTGTSPILVGGRVVLNCDQDGGPSLLLAVGSRDGRTLWQTHRPDVALSYSTPVVWKHGSAEEIVVAGSLRLAGYSIKDGKERWSARGLEATCVCPTPALGDGRLYAMSYSAGDSRPTPFADWVLPKDKDNDHRLSRAEAPAGFVESGGLDLSDLDKDGFITEAEWNESQAQIRRGEPGLFAVRAPGTGDVTATHVVWKVKRAAATVASPLFYRGRVYVVQDGGRVTCRDPASGIALYEQERLSAEGAYHASPVAANGRIFFCSKPGTVTVVAAGDSLRILARNTLSESITATPAIANDNLYIRTADHIWAFSTQVLNR